MGSLQQKLNDTNQKIDSYYRSNNPLISKVVEELYEYKRATENDIDSLKNFIRKSKPGQILGAVKDFGTEFITMTLKNIKHDDHYHHAMANSKATQRGDYGKKTASFLSDGKELFDYLFYGETMKGIREDQAANIHGRNIGKYVVPSEHNKRLDPSRGGKRLIPPTEEGDERTFKGDVKEKIKKIIFGNGTNT